MKNPNKWLIQLYTFIAIFIAIVVTGLTITPFISKKLTDGYIMLQSEVNRRQTEAMEKFINARIAQGIADDKIISEFQQILLGTEVEKGFICLIDQSSVEFLCHPSPKVLGKNISIKGATFESQTSNEKEKWETYIPKAKSNSGLLTFKKSSQPEITHEIIHMRALKQRPWTVNSHENTSLMEKEIATLKRNLYIGTFLIAFLIAIPASIAARAVSRRYERRIREKNKLLEIEKDRSQRLLLNILPREIAEELQNKKGIIAKKYNSVSILFCDIVGFTALSSRLQPVDLVKLLNKIFTLFDRLTDKLGLEKIKTIGDAYMVCSGIPKPTPDHAEKSADMAIGMLNCIKDINNEYSTNLKIRVGINSGEVVAGVIGAKKFIYDLWGDSVNVASRMESLGVDNKIQVTEAFYNYTKDKYVFEERGVISVKGKPKLKTYFLKSRKPTVNAS